ncbi:hypothetical protein [Salipaludibacillus aurantiacus]|uniref:Uncharacterized protein n=1 Tax=Salipaludibacillus aurantiacus TaxID=1601833 RepID=A0A1H9Q6V9_9BACI|nr:hypothetical protein [Salipaludibacillus aurantiacus]SER56177.1 hypothetical protein SAMN05518684_10264 [Salipaludibacillus aurantiacus]
MDKFSPENEKREKKFKIFLFAFIVLAVVNGGLGINEFLRNEISFYGLLFIITGHFFILIFALRRKRWAEWIIIVIVAFQVIMYLLAFIFWTIYTFFS